MEPSGTHGSTEKWVEKNSILDLVLFVSNRTDRRWNFFISSTTTLGESDSTSRVMFLDPLPTITPAFWRGVPDRIHRGEKRMTAKMITESRRFFPITPNIRQVDAFNNYTAGCGHAFATSSGFPASWQNRRAFVCGPTGHLLGMYDIERKGSGFGPPMHSVWLRVRMNGFRQSWRRSVPMDIFGLRIGTISSFSTTQLPV